MKCCSTRNTVIVAVAVLISAIVLTLFLTGSGSAITGNAAGAGSGAGDQAAGTGTQAQASDTVTVSISDIGTDAKFYEYTSSSGKTVRFFAVKDSTGKARIAFDACDVCYGARKGYRQEGSYMVCNNCGNRYAIDGIGTENKAGGGCWPGYLPATTSGSDIIIQNKDLEAGAWRF